MPNAGRNDTSRSGAFDYEAANLRQQGYDDALGFAGDRWEDQPTLYKLAYLADFTVAMGVSFERYSEAARVVVSPALGQQFTPEREWFIAHEFQQMKEIYASRQAMREMRVEVNKISLAELMSEGGTERSSRQQIRDKQLER